MSYQKKLALKKKKIKDQDEFGGKKDKAKEMYANAPVFKALMYVALPGILISFMQGMFIFADQIMMVNLIPSAGSPNMHTIMEAFTSNGNLADNFQYFSEAWNFVLHPFGAKFQIDSLSIDALVRMTVSLITPGLYILNAITILIGMGTAVNFSKAISVRDKLRAYDAWSTGVISTIVFSIISSCIIIGIAQLWVVGMAGSADSSAIEDLLSSTANAKNVVIANGMQETAIAYFQSARVQATVTYTVAGHTKTVVEYVNLYNYLVGAKSGVYFANATGSTSAAITSNVSHVSFTYPAYKSFKSTTVELQPLKAYIFKAGEVNSVLTQNNPIYSEIPNVSMNMITANPFLYIYQPYYLHFHSTAIYWAQFYLRIDAAFNIFACFNQFFSLMIRSEGRQFYPAFLATLANALNICLDAIFILVAKMGVFGSVTALVLGWAFNVTLFIVYIAVMENKTDIVTYLKFTKVRFRYFSWDLLVLALGVGIGAAIWNAGIALQGTLQDMLLTQTTKQLGLPIDLSYYVELNGAMLPIVNLLFNALYGLVQGVTALVSYSYGARRYDRVRKEYWLTLVVAVVYGLLMYLIFGFGINQYLMDGFNITQGIPSPHDAFTFLQRSEYFLEASMLQILVYSFAMPGILLFQALGKVWSTIIACAFQGFVFSFIGLYMMKGIAGAVGGFGGMDIFLYGLPVDSAMSAAVVFSWSAGYLVTRLGKPTRIEINKACNKLLKVDLSVPAVKASSPALSLKSLVVCEK